MVTHLSTEATDAARARSAAYALVAFGFQFPDRMWVDTLADPARWADWPDALLTLDDRIGDHLGAVHRAVATHAGEQASGPEHALAVLQNRHDELFGHAVRGRCAAYEMEYGRHDIIRQASDLADVSGFYRAFGMEPADGADGRPDHITAECEFMSVLCTKESHARAVDEPEHAEVAIKAQRSFLRDHLARWLPAFAHAVQEADSAGLYGALARFAGGFFKGECQRFEIHAGPPTLELRPADPVHDREVSCGPAECGVPADGPQLVQLGTDGESNLEG